MSATHTHTPTPWFVDPTDSECQTVSTETSKAIAECGLDYSTLDPLNGKANAEFIVRACNSHGDLLAALKAFVEPWSKGGDWQSKIKYDHYNNARAAIAKATGK